MERHRPREHLRTDELVEGVVPTDVLAEREQLAGGREERSGVETAGLVERALRRAKKIRQGEDDGASDDRAIGNRVAPNDDLVERRLAADAARGRGDEVALGD